MDTTNLVKIQVFCPRAVVDQVRLAIGRAGGGEIGKYQYCAFVSEGQGYFLPTEGAHPAAGEVGKINQVPEAKIEFFCAKDKVSAVVAAIEAVHPYEEIPIEIFPLLAT